MIIVDALDESIGAPQDDDAHASGSENLRADEILASLVRARGRPRLRLLIGTRRHLLRPLTDGLHARVRVLDLDDAKYADPESVCRYARDCLVRLVDESPYVNQPQAYLDAIADAIAEAAGTSFLVALITARSLALRDAVVDLADRTWRTSLPREAADAMRDDLDQRLGLLAGKARDLLLPLAYAQGSGLPWEDLWPALARALSGKHYTSDDIDWLIGKASYYVVESTQDGQRSTCRLYHEALAEHLRTGRDQRADQAAIVDTLTAHAPHLADGQTDWANANPTPAPT